MTKIGIVQFVQHTRLLCVWVPFDLIVGSKKICLTLCQFVPNSSHFQINIDPLLIHLSHLKCSFYYMIMSFSNLVKHYYYPKFQILLDSFNICINYDLKCMLFILIILIILIFTILEDYRNYLISYCYTLHHMEVN